MSGNRRTVSTTLSADIVRHLSKGRQSQAKIARMLGVTLTPTLSRRPAVSSTGRGGRTRIEPQIKVVPSRSFTAAVG